MGRKCSVFKCQSGYQYVSRKRKAELENLNHETVVQKTESVKTYSFPEDKEECASWLRALPNSNLTYEEVQKKSKNGCPSKCVCALHWPPGVPTKLRNNHQVPAVPPSVFSSDIPPSVFYSPPPPPRPTCKSTSEARNPDVDQLGDHDKQYSFTNTPISDIIPRFTALLRPLGKLAVAENKTDIVLLSHGREGPIFDYTVVFTLVNDISGVTTAVKFEFFQKLKQVTLPYPFSSSNKVHIIKDFTQVEALANAIRLRNIERSNDRKELFIQRQVELMNWHVKPGVRKYSDDDLCKAFVWQATSRALYNTLRLDIELPCKDLLRRITTLARQTEDEEFFRQFFTKLVMMGLSTGCIIIVDEIYVKASIIYSGGVFFGYAENMDGDIPANTVLGIMVKCLFTGKKFLAKLIPCACLTSEYQFDVISKLVYQLEECGGKVLACINDNNKVNQSYFGLFPNIANETPFKCFPFEDHPTRPLFLLYDSTHLVKNYRNNWLTEKTQTLKFPMTDDEGNEVWKVACWSHLRELQKDEFDTDFKKSALTAAAINPSNLEKQKVSLALQVFSEKTVAALRTSTKSTQEWKDTADFIDIVVQQWKMLNCKSKYAQQNLRDDHRVPISFNAQGDYALTALRHWGDMALSMRGELGVKRIQQLTADTGDAAWHTLHGLASMAEYVMSLPQGDPLKHEYVLLGFFQQDDLEHHFGHFRRSAGCNYYVSVRDILNTHYIDRAKLMLEMQTADLDSAHLSSLNHHKCDFCLKPLTEAECLILDDVAANSDDDSVADSISLDEKQAIVFAAGYVAHKHEELKGCPSELPREIVTFVEELSRGGLDYPTYPFLNFFFLSHLFFSRVQDTFCRTRLTSLLTKFPDMFNLNVRPTRRAILRVVNILMNNKQKRENMKQLQCHMTSETTKKKLQKLSSK